MLGKIIYYHMLGSYNKKHMKRLSDAGAGIQEEYHIIVNGGV